MVDRDRRHEEAEEELRSFRAPQEGEAAERALSVVHAAFREREAGARARRRPGLRSAVAGLLAAGGLAIALTPAGASVRDWVEEVVRTEAERPAPPRLPSSGSILTVNDRGAWIAREDGSRRLLGPYRQATASPRGINVAVARGRELAAVTTDGELRWSLTAPARVSDPAWAPSGIRIAYRAGSRLRIVEGNGTHDQSFAREVAPLAPTWRPALPREPARDILAWATRDGEVRVADVVSTSEPIAIATRGLPLQLEWLADGRLAIATSRELTVHALSGKREARFAQPRGATVSELVASPDGARVALSRRVHDRRGERWELALVRVEPGAERQRRPFSTPGEIAGIAFAPDASWIAFGWPSADSWMFIRPRDQSKALEKLEAIPQISERFRDNGTASPLGPGFPTILEWCCSGF